MDEDGSPEAEEHGSPRAAAVVWIAAVIAVGLLAGALVAVVATRSGGDEDQDDRSASTLPVPALEPALLGAGVPEELLACVSSTVEDAGPGAVERATPAPLAPDSLARGAVTACALDHLAGAVRRDAGLDPFDAQCVADQVLERIGLESVLASIGALAVTVEVADAATAAATACAAVP